MKVLFCSYAFWPQTGGIEIIAQQLIKQFVEDGHEIKVLTMVDGESTYEGVEVVRNPNRKQHFDLFRWADSVFVNNISYSLIYPLFLLPKKKHCILLHTYPQTKFPYSFLNRICFKLWKTYAVSDALASKSGITGKVIYNGFDRDRFRASENQKTIDFIFIGRLVSDKGCDMLINAMSKLSSEARCVVVGEGPEKASLQKNAPGNTQFLGKLDQETMVKYIQQSRWLVAPSRWEEPFGLVAIEAIASGTPVIAADHGGLPEAVGDCGLLFKANDQSSLEETMIKAISENEIATKCLENRISHLAKFSFETQYSEIMKVMLAEPLMR